MAREFRERKQKCLEGYINSGKFELFEDLVSIIKYAKRDGIPQAAVSSSENAKKILERLNLIHDFDSTTLGAIKHRALNKESLYSFAFGRLCERLGFSDLPYPIVFEDADKGIVAAKKLGYLCVGIARRGLSTEISLKEVGADLVYNEQNIREKGYLGVLEDIRSKINFP